MAKQTSTGYCILCKRDFSRPTMTRHLQTCMPAPPQPAQPGLHLFVEGRYAKDYWLHLAVPAKARLSLLDGFLRHIWLECCGHLSAFNIAGLRYSASPMGDYNEAGMGATLQELLKPGMSLSYEYDFGSTTELSLKATGRRDLPGKSKGVQLLARNHPPQIACDQCGNHPATQICTECAWSGKGWLCKFCASEHECGDDMFLPVVNSPRAGVCGYGG